MINFIHKKLGALNIKLRLTSSVTLYRDNGDLLSDIYFVLRVQYNSRCVLPFL